MRDTLIISTDGVNQRNRKLLIDKLVEAGWHSKYDRDIYDLNVVLDHSNYSRIGVSVKPLDIGEIDDYYCGFFVDSLGTGQAVVSFCTSHFDDTVTSINEKAQLLQDRFHWLD